MMINYILGDVTKATNAIIAHGCNAQGVMGSGVAKVIRDKFPKAYEDYRGEYASLGSTARNQGHWLGQVVYSSVSDNVIIANCITQRYYGSDGQKYASYDAIEQAYEDVFKMAAELNLVVATVEVGCGLGGAKWPVVYAILNELSEKYGVSCDVYVIDQARYQQLTNQGE